MVITSSAKSQRLGINHSWNSSLNSFNNFNRVDLENLFKGYLKRLLKSSVFYIYNKHTNARLFKQGLLNSSTVSSGNIPEPFIGSFSVKPNMRGFSITFCYHLYYGNTSKMVNAFITNRFKSFEKLLLKITGCV